MKFKVLAAMLVATTAIAALSPIDDLNKAVVGLLKPINNKLTTAALVFTALEVDDKRALNAGVEVDYRKKGALTDLRLSIPDLSYHYKGAFGPVASFNVSAEADLLAILDRELINELGPVASEIINDLAMQFLEDYGPAASVEVKTVEESYDDEGNLEKIVVSGRVRVNLDKLPDTVPVSEVPITSMTIRLTAGLRGIGAQGTVIMNKDFKAFEEDQMGLKETIESLLAQEKETMTDIQDLAMSIDEFINMAVNEGFKDGGEDELDYDEEMDLIYIHGDAQ